MVGNPEDRFSHKEAHINEYAAFLVAKQTHLSSTIIRHKPGCTATEAGKKIEISD